MVWVKKIIIENNLINYLFIDHGIESSPIESSEIQAIKNLKMGTVNIKNYI